MCKLSYVIMVMDTHPLAATGTAATFDCRLLFSNIRLDSVYDCNVLRQDTIMGTHFALKWCLAESYLAKRTCGLVRFC